MDVTIIAALIGAVGSIVAAVIGARLTSRSASSLSRSPQQPALVPGSQHDATTIHPIGFGPLLLIALAGFLFVMGFALFGYVVLAFTTTIFTAIQASAPAALRICPPSLSFRSFPSGLG